MNSLFGRAKIKSSDQFFKAMLESKDLADFILKHLEEAEQFVNDKDKAGFTPLHIAALREDAKAFNTLAIWANQSTEDQDGRTPIQIAMLGSESFFKDLTESYLIDFKKTNSKGQTTLHNAIEAGNFDVAYILSTRTRDRNKKHPPINSQDNAGDTALHYLVRQKDLDPTKAVDLIEHMKKNGADLSIINNKGRTVIDEAVVNGNIKIALAFITKLSFKSNDHEKRKKLSALAQNRPKEEHDQIIEALGLSKSLETRERTKSTSTASTTSASTATEPAKKIDPYDELGSDTKFLVKLQEHSGGALNQKIIDKLAKYVTRKKSLERESIPTSEEVSRLKAKFEKSSKDKTPYPEDSNKFLKMIDNNDKDFKSLVKINSYERLKRKTQEYEEGRASKGAHHLLALPLTLLGRKTDNDMIKELTTEYQKYEKDPNYQIQLPQRWNLTKSSGRTK